jgi:peroxiredoxin
MKEDALAETTSSLPQVGDTLPDFDLLGTDGARHSIADLARDHRGLILFYFPKANTDG